MFLNPSKHECLNDWNMQFLVYETDEKIHCASFQLRRLNRLCVKIELAGFKSHFNS